MMSATYIRHSNNQKSSTPSFFLSLRNNHVNNGDMRYKPDRPTVFENRARTSENMLGTRTKENRNFSYAFGSKEKRFDSKNILNMYCPSTSVHRESCAKFDLMKVKLRNDNDKFFLYSEKSEESRKKTATYPEEVPNLLKLGLSHPDRRASPAELKHVKNFMIPGSITRGSVNTREQSQHYVPLDATAKHTQCSINLESRYQGITLAEKKPSEMRLNGLEYSRNTRVSNTIKSPEIWPPGHKNSASTRFSTPNRANRISDIKLTEVRPHSLKYLREPSAFSAQSNLKESTLYDTRPVGLKNKTANSRSRVQSNTECINQLENKAACLSSSNVQSDIRPPDSKSSVNVRVSCSTSNTDSSSMSDSEISSSSLENLSKKYISSARENASYENTLSEIRPVGLTNLGNTCFMNACIQCLVSTKALTRKLMANLNRGLIKVNADSKKGNLAFSLAELIYKMGEIGQDSKRNMSIVPYNLFNTLKISLPYFSDFGQHDSQEFLSAFLCELSDDMKKKMKSEDVSKKEISIDDLPRMEQSDIRWRNFYQKNNSFISDTFFGQLESMIQCNACGTKSYAFDPFMELSLPISKSGDSVSLHQCLKKQFSVDDLVGSNAFMCRHCKCKREGKKRLTISRFPEVLIVHLKRFEYLASGSRKLKVPVSFPVENLDMADFISVEGCATPFAKPPIYELYAAVNHEGSVENGHYTSVCADENKNWYNINDEHVSNINGINSNQSSSSIYMLFYKIVENK